MKHTYKLLAVLGIMILVLVGCSSTNEITGPERTPADVSTDNEEVAFLKMVNDQKTMSYPIWANNNVNVGVVRVRNDFQYLYVTYEMIKGWFLDETNLHLSDDVRGIPMSREGIPNPEQFDYRMKHKANQSVYTYKIPYANHAFSIGQEITIAAQATITNPNFPSGKGDIQSVWAGIEMMHDKNPLFVILFTLKESSDNGEGLKPHNVIVERSFDRSILN